MQGHVDPKDYNRRAIDVPDMALDVPDMAGDVPDMGGDVPEIARGVSDIFRLFIQTFSTNLTIITFPNTTIINVQRKTEHLNISILFLFIHRLISK